MAELYLRMMNNSHNNIPNALVHNQLPSSFISPSRFNSSMSSRSPQFSPVNRVDVYFITVFNLQVSTHLMDKVILSSFAKLRTTD